MTRPIRFAWEHRGGLAALLVLLAGALAGLYRASRLDEGYVKHLKKQLGEARRMPGRLLT
ncbi:MAG: hypothetical protein KKB90_13165 [Actinobacteria bacterium]|nr:hypothetical protein [Actinomycetota bacterium]MCG2820103.1 hypothetical protein [Actinomycetes bacterium]MBU4219889.1 hypothetical protein [Actinomycetota bacterium]MBU4359779.1 hypothetical protein [Actinomycetota bacterium]MBU4392366.1 hypothetical protein [Actinomycetota bacterium]